MFLHLIVMPLIELLSGTDSVFLLIEQEPSLDFLPTVLLVLFEYLLFSFEIRKKKYSCGLFANHKNFRLVNHKFLSTMAVDQIIRQ